MKRLLLLTAIILTLFISCSKEGTTLHDSDAFVGTWKCITGSYLVITKIDAETINMKRIEVWGQDREWDRTWISNVSGTDLIITLQDGISGTGNLFGENLLTIDYYYSNSGEYERGITYTRIEDVSSIPIIVAVSLPGTTWKCSSGTPWPNDLEYWSFKFGAYPKVDVLVKQVGYPVRYVEENFSWLFNSTNNHVTIQAYNTNITGVISNDGKSMNVTASLTGSPGTYLFIRQ